MEKNRESMGRACNEVPFTDAFFLPVSSGIDSTKPKNHSPLSPTCLESHVSLSRDSQSELTRARKIASGIKAFQDRLGQLRATIDDSGVANFDSTHPEKKLDATDGQRILIRSERPLKLGSGLIYWGTRHLDTILQEGTNHDYMFMTRVGYEYGRGGFYAAASTDNPAFILMRTETFRQYEEEKRAFLNTPGDRKGGNIEPSAQIKPGEFSLEDVYEIWVCQTTYDRYLALRDLTNSNKLSDALKNNLEMVFSKLRVVPELQLNTTPQSTERWNDTERALFLYTAERNFLKEIPLFEYGPG